ACPHCAATQSFVACGPGVERLEEEVAGLFPDARMLVLSSDLVASIERMREELKSVADGHVDIVIGTQVVAKGHHFPKLNLGGVARGAGGRAKGDPRAAGRTCRLLHQAAGRGGGAGGRGGGLLQTHEPDHRVVRAWVAEDGAAFYAAETPARGRAGYPPFGRL